MPITIFPPNGQATMVIGPGSVLNASTDFIGPLPSGTTWLVSLTSDPEGGHLVADGNTTSESHLVQFQVGVDTPGWGWQWPGLAGLAEGQSATVAIQLRQPGGAILDSGTAQFPWSVGAAGEAWQAAQGTGGLTAQQAQQLEETQLATFPTVTLDDITLVEQSPGITPGPVNFFLPEPTMMIIVRLANVPADLAPQTPDDDYWVKTLAVVRLFRGQDLWKRWPIHTSSKLITLYDENILAGAAAVFFSQWLLQLSCQVTFLPGVTGQVFISSLP